MAGDIDKITSIQVTNRAYGDRTLPGEALNMQDGSTWFHPYSGGAPVLVIRPQIWPNQRTIS